jgi:ATP-dependent exoDNAse (exonuclease V) beta subunit
MPATALTHPEMPSLWRIDDVGCLEGIVDLALFDPAARKWLILGWKTNRIAPDKIDNLRAQYRPQIAAYWQAVTQMTRMLSGLRLEFIPRPRGCLSFTIATNSRASGSD